MFHRTAGLPLLVIAACSTITTACHRNVHPSALDLFETLSSAEMRSALPREEAFAESSATIDAREARVVRTCGTTRITWHFRLPARPVLRVALASDPTGGDGPAGFRIAISDRRYDGLFERKVASKPSHGVHWEPVTIDLRSYEGWQWSIFYRPSRIIWNVIFSFDAGRDGAGHSPCGLWGAPRIESRP